jgi:hypothetical protein
MAVTIWRICRRCGRRFFKSDPSNRAKYCPPCRPLARRQKDAARARRYRERRDQRSESHHDVDG